MRTCILTGASSGIGRATAIKLSEMNEYDHIALIARNADELSSTIKQMKAGPQIYPFILNLEELHNIPTVIKDIYKKCGSIDCVLNIAGYTDPQPLLNTTIDNMQTTFSINVFSVFLIIKEAVKYMRLTEHECKILNVASTAGITPRPGWLSYSSSKAAIISMSQTLSDELAEYNIKVYCVSPGRCATALRRKLAPDEDQSRIMQPSEVGEIICNLISQNETCLDGQNIIVRKKTDNV